MPNAKFEMIQFDHDKKLNYVKLAKFLVPLLTPLKPNDSTI